VNGDGLRIGQNVRAWQEAIARMGGPVMRSCPDCCGIGWLRAASNPGHQDFGKLVRCPACEREMRRMRP